VTRWGWSLDDVARATPGQLATIAQAWADMNRTDDA